MATALGSPRKSENKKLGVGKTIGLIFLGIMLVFYLIPVYVMVVNGLKTADVVSFSRMWQLPSKLSLGGYGQAWDKLSPNVWSSVTLVVPATIISGFLGALNGYILSKWKFRGSDLLFTLMLFGMFIPYQSILIPLIKFLQSIGLYGNMAGLILVHVVYGLPFTTLIFRNYFANVPTELVEAATVDGAGLLQIFFQVMLPLSIPAFVVVGIFQFTNIWNEFLFGLTVITNPARQPITVALNNLSGSFSVEWNVVMAGAVLTALPTLLIYIVLGKYFVRGIMAGSVKG
ncbi:MAG: carbohydrate ABC transporter permease [Thermomicrobiales bacterium]|nr:carbohydrate ABC transporter permease [Thermomicrobiales bacterium]